MAKAQIENGVIQCMSEICHTKSCEYYNECKDVESPLKMQGTIDKLKQDIEKLRDLVYGYDIPSPTIPEYRELHEKMQSIMKFIDTKLLGEV